MGCNCGNKNQQVKYLWTSDDGKTKQEYTSEVQAKAAVIRRGGSYVSKR